MNNPPPTLNLPQTLLVMANSHGFTDAYINPDGSVTVWIPWAGKTSAGQSWGATPRTCRTVHDMRSVLGY